MNVGETGSEHLNGPEHGENASILKTTRASQNASEALFASNVKSTKLRRKREHGDHISHKVVVLCALFSMLDSGSAPVFTNRPLFLCGV